MEAVFILAIWLGILGAVGMAGELWAYIQDRHEKEVARRIRARRMARQLPRKKERVDYWAA